jgi:hypothetical protein
MVGGFILVAFLLCILLAWPGLMASARLGKLAAAARFLATAAVRDLRDPLH